MTLPRAVDVRAAHRAAVAGFFAGDREAAREALSRLKTGLHQMEAEAREACRGGPGVGRPRAESEQVCAALAGISAINDDMDEHLDPGGESAGQVLVLDRLARTVAEKLGIPMLLSPFARLPSHAVSHSPSRRPLALARRARGPAGFPRCRVTDRRVVAVGPMSVDAAHLAEIGGRPVLAWWADCASAGLLCPTEGISVLPLTPAGRPAEALRYTGVRAAHWGAGQGFILAPEINGESVLVFHNDGDVFVQQLSPQLTRVGRARLVLVQAEDVVPEIFAGGPFPGWLWVRRPGRRVTLLRFAHRHRRPLSTSLVLGGDGAFGRPAVIGGDWGYAVAATTVRDLVFLRFDPQGKPVGPARALRLRRRGLVDPRRTLIAQRPGGFAVLTLGVKGTPGAAAAVLTVLDQNGSVKRFVELDVPLAPERGRPLSWLAIKGRLVLVFTTREGDRRTLWMQEYLSDGRRAGRSRAIATISRFAGALAVERGFVAAYARPRPEAPTKPPGIDTLGVARLVCE